MSEAGADIITAITMTNAAEAIGVARAAKARRHPSVISFTVETDGRLPDGQTFADAVNEVDAATDAAPAYYMINCAHPTHFAEALGADVRAAERIGGVRANASRMSHAELNEAPELDRGDATDLGARYRALRERWPGMKVLGGCCGTDHTHIAAIARACA